MSRWSFTVLTILGMLASSAAVSAAEEVYSAPRPEDVRGKVLVWSAEQADATPARQEALRKIWTWEGEAPTADEVLDRVVDSFAVWNDSVAQLIASSQRPGVFAPSLELMQSTNPFFRANVGLFLGRSFVERRMFDEANEVLKQVDVKETVDPASYFFYRAVSSQALLEIKPALEAIEQLLKHTENVPVRYSTTATLMQTELANLKERSLGEVARLMSDSERRLELGRAGEKVQGVQDRIIDNLDELIKKAEAQGGGGGGGGGGQSNSNESGSPAEDSNVKGQTAPGETDPKKLSKEGVWGNLPPKDAAAAKNEIDRNFPTHYPHAIEAYSKKLAKRAAKKR